MPTVREHITDLAFDRFFGDELGSAERRELEQHLGACVHCQLRHEAHETQRAAFLARAPSWQAFSSRKIARRQNAAARWAFWSGSALAVAAAAVALLAILPSGSAPAAVRSKGRPTIGAFLKRGSRVERVQRDDAVRPGDLLRMTYSTALRREFALFHRDGQHTVIEHPLGAQTLSVDPGRDVALDFSLRIDPAPGPEHFYGVFCEQPAELEPLRAALDATGQLPPTTPCEIDTLTLTKVVGREAAE